jgi:lipoate-protein ligase A
MSRILKVPDEKFRDKVFKTIEENVTTLRKELGAVPPREEVVKVLKERFEKRIGSLKAASLTPEVIEKMKELESWMTSDEFLHQKTPRIPAGVKIREGVEVLYGLHKARGGLIRTAEEIVEGRIEDIAISGDFQFYPKEGLSGLEGSLEKVPLDEEKIVERVETFYKEKGVESPGVESKDFATTILNPIQTSKRD